MEITYEREVVSVLRQPAPVIHGPCMKCGRDVLKLTAEAATAASEITAREIYRWLDEERIHFEESAAGQVFICSESLKSLSHGSKLHLPEARID